MSSEVQAKCRKSFIVCVSGPSPSFSRMKYSTALTSWLVVASMALTRSASSMREVVDDVVQNVFHY